MISSSGRKLHLVELDTPLGKMTAGATEKGICLLLFSGYPPGIIEQMAGKMQAESVNENHLLLDKLRKELGEYFNGERKVFTVPLDIMGTPFQQKVWRVLQQITYGTTRTYGEQSRLLGNPAAIRAVAHANGQNPIAILIPCHRVIGDKGRLTGYAGGLEKKKWLLELEGRTGRLF